MKWLFALLLFSAAFASTGFVRVVDTEVGYAEVSGLEEKGDLYEVTGDTLALRASSTRDFTAINYSVSVTPRNLERLLEDMDVPLAMGLSYEVPAGASFEDSVMVPDIACGTYTAQAQVYYAVNGTLARFEDSVKVQLPCKDFKSSVLSGLFARLPYGLLKGVAGFLGFNF